MSSEIDSSHDNLDLPLTCHRPVIPGLTPRRCRARTSYRSTSLGRAGRGPINDISPRITLRSCGSSSSDSLRKTRPTRVTRGSSFILNSPRPTSLESSSSARCASASSVIVRSLSILKVRSPSRTRVCRNNAGPGESSLMATANASRSGSIKTNKTRARTVSPAAFACRTRPVGRDCETHMTIEFPTQLTRTRRALVSRRLVTSVSLTPSASRDQRSSRNHSPLSGVSSRTATSWILRRATSDTTSSTPPRTGTPPTDETMPARSVKQTPTTLDDVTLALFLMTSAAVERSATIRTLGGDAIPISRRNVGSGRRTDAAIWTAPRITSKMTALIDSVGALKATPATHAAMP